MRAAARWPAGCWSRSGWRWPAGPGRGWPTSLGYPPAARRCCAWSAPCPTPNSSRWRCWASTTSRCAAATSTAASWSTWPATDLWSCWLTGRPTPSPTGCASTPASRSCAAIAPVPTPTAPIEAHPRPCRSPTAGTCGTTSPSTSRRPWRATAAAFASPNLPSRSCRLMRPPESTLSRSPPGALRTPSWSGGPSSGMRPCRRCAPRARASSRSCGAGPGQRDRAPLLSGQER